MMPTTHLAMALDPHPRCSANTSFSMNIRLFAITETARQQDRGNVLAVVHCWDFSELCTTLVKRRSTFCQRTQPRLIRVTCGDQLKSRSQ